jgi:hypothetical protein
MRTHMDNKLHNHSSIVSRLKLAWPNGARVTFYVEQKGPSPLKAVGKLVAALAKYGKVCPLLRTANSLADSLACWD